MRKTTISLSLILSLLLTTACGNSNDSKSPAASSTTGNNTSETKEVNIRFAFWGTPDEKLVQEKIKDAFEKEHPNIKVTLDHVSSANDFPASVLTQIAGGNAPDVFYIGEALVSSFVKKDVLMDMLPLAKENNFDFDDFFPALLDPMGYNDGHMWAFPKDATPYMIYYNKELFDKANVPYPTNEWTWDDFDKAAKALTSEGDSKSKQYGFAQDLWWGPLMTSIYKNGGKLLSDDGKSMRLDDPKISEALDWYKSLMYKDGGVSPTPDGLQGTGMSTVDMFLAGKAAMVSGGRWVSYSLEPLAGKWGVVPFPQKTENSSPLLFVTLAMPKNTEHPKEAFEFIKFYVSQTAQEINSSTGLGMPVLKSVTNSGKWLLEGEPQEHVQVFFDQLSNAKSLPFHPVWSKTIDEIFMREIDPALRNLISVEDALGKAKTEIDKVLNQ